MATDLRPLIFPTFYFVVYSHIAKRARSTLVLYQTQQGQVIFYLAEGLSWYGFRCFRQWRCSVVLDIALGNDFRQTRQRKLSCGRSLKNAGDV